MFRSKIAGFFAVSAFILSNTAPAAAQILETPATETETEPVEEIITAPEDTVGPAFISVAAVSAEETQINIVWTTDEPAYGYIQYGETPSYGLATPKSSGAALDHTVSITGLAAGTTYHYRIIAEDESDNISYSKDRIFETAIEIVAIDNAPPEITDISVTNISTSGATLGWATNELAQGRVEYGQTVQYGAASPMADDYAIDHSIAITNLNPGTEYHYRIVARDESGNESVSPDEIFTTEAEPQPEPEPEPEPEPVIEATSTAPASTTTPEIIALTISGVETAQIGTTTATITWQTNKSADAQIFYGAGEIYASSSPISGAGQSHSIKITGLKPGTNYFYKVVSKDASGQTVEKSGFEFNTLFAPKKAVKNPSISNLRITAISTSTAVILFDTDLPATGKINYGKTTGYGRTDGGHLTLLTKHSHPLSGLEPNTGYNFITIVRDSSGNETIYENKTFKTLAIAPAGNVPQEPGIGEEPNQETAEESQATVTDETTESEETGGPAGGHYSYTHTPALKHPKIIKAEALDGQAMFIWTPEKPPKAGVGSSQIRTNTLIVRNPVSYPSNPGAGKIVYKGNSGLFTDAHLQNDRPYYYSIFTANQVNSHSQPIRFKIVPKKSKIEMTLEAVPPVVQKNPIYAFPKILKLGDRNKQIEHLQILLALDPAIYPKRLITGYFGRLTEGAVRKFQKRHQLKPTGIADKPTLKKLEMLSNIEIVNDGAEVFNAALTRNLKFGFSGGDVSVLQQFLINAGVYPEGLITGYFGSLTQSALARFQKEQNIVPANGYFGPITRTRILNLIRLRAIKL